MATPPNGQSISQSLAQCYLLLLLLCTRDRKGGNERWFKYSKNKNPFAIWISRYLYYVQGETQKRKRRRAGATVSRPTARLLLLYMFFIAAAAGVAVATAVCYMFVYVSRRPKEVDVLAALDLTFCTNARASRLSSPPI
jgi:hypothetical protein